MKRTQLCLCSVSTLSSEDEKVDLLMYYTVNMAVVNYFGTQIPKFEKTDGHMQIEPAELHCKDLTESEDQFHFRCITI